LLGLGVAGLAYLAARRVRTNQGTPSMGEVRETVGDVRSGEAFEIPIDETRQKAKDAIGSVGGGEKRDADESETGAGAGEGAGTTEGAIGNEPMPGEDISDPEIEERAAEDAHEEPKQPGEMTVDEELAEEVVDEDVADEREAEEGAAVEDEIADTDESDDEENA
jgi:hypothetical protein